MQPEKEYLEHLAQKRFMIQHSPATGEYVFYPRVAAPRSGATPERAARLERQKQSGDALLVALWRQATPAQKAHIDAELASYRDDFADLAANR